jgi:hypothetical protein
MPRSNGVLGWSLRLIVTEFDRFTFKAVGILIDSGTLKRHVCWINKVSTERSCSNKPGFERALSPVKSAALSAAEVWSGTFPCWV